MNDVVAVNDATLILLGLTACLGLVVLAFAAALATDGGDRAFTATPPAPTVPGPRVALRAHRAGYALGSCAQRGQLWASAEYRAVRR